MSIEKFAMTEIGSSNSDSLSIASFRPILSSDKGCLRRLSLNRFSSVRLLASRKIISVGRFLDLGSLIMFGICSKSADILRASILVATFGMSVSFLVTLIKIAADSLALNLLER